MYWMPDGQRNDSVDDGRRRSGCVRLFLSRRLTIAVVAVAGLLPLSCVADEPPAAEAQGATGSIRGRVDIRRILAPPEARPNVSALSSPTKLDAHDLQRAVVFLDAQDVPERSPLRTAARPA